MSERITNPTDPIPRRENIVIILVSLCLQFVLSVFESIRALVRSIISGKAGSIRPNRLLEIMHFVLYTGPKKFWRKPTGIKMGRSIATLIHYVFYRERSFTIDAPTKPHAKK